VADEMIVELDAVLGSAIFSVAAAGRGVGVPGIGI
jgi:hypothetical protein